MGFQTIPSTNTQYGLISFDENGVERQEGGRLFSEALIAKAAADSYTNVFFFCHGWKGDMPEAIAQYDKWIQALANSDDSAKAPAKFPGFKPLFMGLHWPSLPFGDEEMSGGGSFAPGTAMNPDALLNLYLKRLGDRPEIRMPLQIIFDEARHNSSPSTLPEPIKRAYENLDRALGLGSDGPGAPPDADREGFDPEDAPSRAQGSDFGGFSLGAILSPAAPAFLLDDEKRARLVGEGGMHTFLKSLQQASPALRIHLMGHSFGTIVISSMIGGPGGNQPLLRPIDSVVLVQGAVSLWCYSPNIPFPNAGAGYFTHNLTPLKIKGPLVTTRSKWDRAVGSFYPLASLTKDGSASFGLPGFPEYGGIGAFGLQGLSNAQEDLAMRPTTEAYNFAAGKVYNLESSQYIRQGGGASGAHSDIAGSGSRARHLGGSLRLRRSLTGGDGVLEYDGRFGHHRPSSGGGTGR